MAVKKRDVVFIGKTESGDKTIDMPITRLGNIEDDAEIKVVPTSEDYIPIMDMADGGQMKKTPYVAPNEETGGGGGSLGGGIIEEIPIYSSDGTHTCTVYALSLKGKYISVLGVEFLVKVTTKGYTLKSVWEHNSITDVFTTGYISTTGGTIYVNYCDDKSNGINPTWYVNVSGTSVNFKANVFYSL